MSIVDRLKHAVAKAMQPVNHSGGGRGWLPLIAEPFMGAWQKNQEQSREEVTKFFAVFSCVSLISEDMGKLWINLKKNNDGILETVTDKRFSFLKKPNNFQTWQQFVSFWIISKLLRGNAYVLKLRDIRGEISGLYILNPDLVETLVSDAGEVFYRVKTDKLSGITDTQLVLPASEIIHDRMNCFYHALVGLPPLIACELAASQGLAAQVNSRTLFQNMSRPSGILTSPNNITVDQAKDIKSQWDTNYIAGNYGKTAVLGNAMKYEPMSMAADDAQLIEQLKMSAEMVCSAFRVPPFKAGIGAIPAGNKVGDLNEIYYSDCLQSLIEAIENLLNEQTGIADAGYTVEFDLDSLIRMDSTSQIAFLEKAVKATIMAPNEARAKLNYKPAPGGNAPLSQQQNFSLEALAKRDAKDDPFGKAVDTPPANPDTDAEADQKAIRLFQKYMSEPV